MYDYFKGTLESLSPTKATLEVFGIGYEFYISHTTSSFLQSQVGKEIKLYATFVVREDSHRLFGFIQAKEKETFNKLSEVSGIGPKTALAILGSISLQELDRAIYSQDIKTLSTIPGVGKKTAERLILELKDKLCDLKILEKVPSSDSKDAIAALLNLGYKEAVAIQAVKMAAKDSSDEIPLATLIGLSLKIIRNL